MIGPYGALDRAIIEEAIVARYRYVTDNRAERRIADPEGTDHERAANLAAILERSDSTARLNRYSSFRGCRDRASVR